MDNAFKLTALLYKVDVLRYTPAGIAVLEVILKHESWQEENGAKCLITFELPAKIVGKSAEIWQYRQGEMVVATGFIAQKSQRNTKPILRIQNIQEYKG